jgi:hypothetical protein
MIDIKASVRVMKNNMWSNNIQYEVLFLKDRLLFVKTGGEFAKRGGTGSYLSNTIAVVVGVVILGRIGGSLYGLEGAGIGGAVGAAIGIGVSLILARKNKKNIEQKLSNLENRSVEEILQADKKNFEIPFSEITSFKVDKSKVGLFGARNGVLIIEGSRKLRLDIFDKQKFEDIERLVLSAQA